MHCVVHQDLVAVGVCQNCGVGVCPECAVRGEYLPRTSCPSCLDPAQERLTRKFKELASKVAAGVSLEELQKDFSGISETEHARIDEQDLVCSFCGKDQSEVAKLVAGPTVYICDECVGLCVEIFEEEDIPLPRKKLPPST